MKIVDAIKNDLKGAAILADWLGSGGEPVGQKQADERARICNQCSENTGGKWWTTAKHKIADAIKEQIEVKNKMELHAKGEETLQLCRICGCCNSLAVWTPIVHIAHHTNSEMLSKFPKWCYKRVEIERAFIEK